MPVTVHNPYSGEDDQTCSVSFAAQQQMAGTVGSSQTEAEWTKSKILGEIGVMKAKDYLGEIPDGTKVFAYEAGQTHGYFVMKGGKLQQVYYFKGKRYAVTGYWDDAVDFTNNPNVKVSIPQAVAPKPKPEPVSLTADDIKSIGNNPKAGVVGVKASGEYVMYDPDTDLFSLHEADPNGYGNVVSNSSYSLGELMKSDEGWLKPDGKAVTPNSAPKTTVAPPLPSPQPVAAPTPAAPVHPASPSVGSMSHEDVAAMFVKIKDDLAKEKGLNIKGANPELDKEVFKAIGDATGYSPDEVKAKIDAYKAAGNKLSALKKKVLAGTKKVPPTTKLVKDPPPIGTPPAPSPTQVAPKLDPATTLSKKETLENLAALGEEGNGYLKGGTGAVGFKTSTVGVNKLGDQAAKQFGEPLGTGLTSIAEKHGLLEQVDMATTDVYTNQTWLFSKVVKKYVNNPGDAAVLAVRKDGKLIVIDGNHRAAAAKLANGKVKMVVLDLDSKNPTTIGGNAGHDQQPNGVPTVATAKLVNDVKATVTAKVDAQPTKVYSDEDVAAAYIIAKDKVVAESSGKWTLYSKSDEMDLEIAIQVGLKTGLNPAQQKQAIANYLASGKKLSVLKKQLIKQGAFEAKADTLKKSGTAKTLDDKKKDVDAKADAGYTPTPNPATGTPKMETGKPAPKAAQESAEKAGAIDHIPASVKAEAFKQFKNTGSQSWLSSGEASNYEGFITAQAAMRAQGKELTMLQLIRIVDEQGAAKAGVANGKLFEKQVATWLTTPAGTAHIKALEKKKLKLAEEAKLKAEIEKKAKEMEANQPPLPADSAQYQPWSLQKAREVSKTWLDKEPWTDKQRRDLKHYTGSAYSEMNGYLRGTRSSISDRSKSAIAGAKAGMRPTTEPVLLARGTGMDQFASLGLTRNSGDAIFGITGKTVKDGGFLSTSAGGTAAFSREVNLEIECPVGTPMAYIAPISNFPHENEMLLQAGVEYKVLNVRKVNGRYVVRMRVVNWPGKAS